MQTQSANSRQSTQEGLGQYPVVYGLIGLLALIHLYTMSLNPLERALFYQDYANHAPSVLNGEYYRLLTSMFLHADLTHLFFNGMGLLVIGQSVEKMFGSLRLLVIYFLGGLTGSVASFIFLGGASIGASGAVFAVFGALAAYFVRHRELYGKAAAQQLRSMAVIAAINLFIGVMSQAPGSNVRIDNAAHIGGALGGFVLAFLITPVYQVRMEIQPEGQLYPRLIDSTPPGRWMISATIYALGLLLVTMLAINLK